MFIIKVSSIAFALAHILAVFIAPASAQEAIKVMDNGPDGARIIVAVLGDGYAKSDKSKFDEDVRSLIIDGIFAKDFYRQNRRAFNVYQLNCWSADSGVSTKTTKRDTAFDLLYTGSWNEDWIRYGSRTHSAISSALSRIPKYDYVTVICNENGWGGCCSGTLICLTRGKDRWPTVAHELGHGLGRLLDEYGDRARIYKGAPINFKNASTIADRKKICWSKLLLDSTSIPTSTLSAEPSNGVGVYEGGATWGSGVYRPAIDCRMRTNEIGFCPVCREYMSSAVKPYMAAPLPSFDLSKFLHFGFTINKNSEWSLDSLTEAEGPLLLRKNYQTSNFLIESYDTKGRDAVQFVLQNPYLSRVFARKNNKMELVKNTKSGQISFSIPEQGIGGAKENKLGLRLYELKGDQRLRTIDLPTLKRLKERKQVDLRLDLTPERLSSAMDNLQRR